VADGAGDGTGGGGGGANAAGGSGGISAGQTVPQALGGIRERAWPKWRQGGDGNFDMDWFTAGGGGGGGGGADGMYLAKCPLSYLARCMAAVVVGAATGAAILRTCRVRTSEEAAAVAAVAMA
jgi:hypothetical protein